MDDHHGVPASPRLRSLSDEEEEKQIIQEGTEETKNKEEETAPPVAFSQVIHTQQPPLRRTPSPKPNKNKRPVIIIPSNPKMRSSVSRHQYSKSQNTPPSRSSNNKINHPIVTQLGFDEHYVQRACRVFKVSHIQFNKAFLHFISFYQIVYHTEKLWIQAISIRSFFIYNLHCNQLQC